MFVGKLIYKYNDFFKTISDIKIKISRFPLLIPRTRVIIFQIPGSAPLLLQRKPSWHHCSEIQLWFTPFQGLLQLRFEFKVETWTIICYHCHGNYIEYAQKRDFLQYEIWVFLFYFLKSNNRLLSTYFHIKGSPIKGKTSIIICINQCSV